mmetsp:Transcript_3160/g.4569  ORF Transcript_3160/g.4569 Transcript_3160/m.4569 type:complete len:138 (+) Transcript_3160:98-511(+)
MSPSLTTDLHMNANGALTPEKTRSDIKYTIRGWHLRPAAQNDAALRNAFCSVLEASALLPPDQRLIMYDAEDGGAISEPLGGPFLRKRLDARRNTKPKKADGQRFVCTPFDPSGFHFGKIKNPGTCCSSAMSLCHSK